MDKFDDMLYCISKSLRVASAELNRAAYVKDVQDETVTLTIKETERSGSFLEIDLVRYNEYDNPVLFIKGELITTSIEFVDHYINIARIDVRDPILTKYTDRHNLITVDIGHNRVKTYAISENEHECVANKLKGHVEASSTHKEYFELIHLRARNILEVIKTVK